MTQDQKKGGRMKIPQRRTEHTKEGPGRDRAQHTRRQRVTGQLCAHAWLTTREDVQVGDQSAAFDSPMRSPTRTKVSMPLSELAWMSPSHLTFAAGGKTAMHVEPWSERLMVSSDGSLGE